jgi:hypothetical protein
MKKIDISKFTQKDNAVLYDLEIFLVVKSQNQIERRERMLESKKKNRYGRFKPSPTAIGLLVKGRLKDGIVLEEWKKEFREPRHIKKLSNGNFMLTEINKLLEIDPKGDIIRTYSHPFFGYLHTIDVSKDENRALVVSSGYDALIEIDLRTSEETFSWFAWEHGFNPSKDGTWYAANEEVFKKYLRENKKSILIDPKEYGEQGVTTANRVAHPNAAIYDHSAKNPSAIVSIGHNGLLSRIDLMNGNITHLYSNLTVMAHGIYPIKDNGLMITQTTKGEWLWLNKYYEEERIFDFKKIKGKVPGTEDAEWIQQIVPLDESKALAIDANRGLIALDVDNEMYSVYHHNENWCIQDSIFL